MKRFLALTAFMVILICPVKAVRGGPVTIWDVYTDPMEPTNIEVITINVSGSGVSSAAWIDGSDFQIEGTSLGLDVFVRLGQYGVPSVWSHSEVIGTLPADFYDLTVRAYSYSQLTKTYELSDTYLTGFTVVPEPATLLLLGFGAVMLKRRRGRATGN